jgi:hypothetical protein
MSIEATEIEKKSLEAHVELCAERYNALDTRLVGLDEKIAGVNHIVCEVRDMVEKMSEKRTDQLVSWGMAAIGFLVATCGYLISHYVLK